MSIVELTLLTVIVAVFVVGLWFLSGIVVTVSVYVFASRLFGIVIVLFLTVRFLSFSFAVIPVAPSYVTLIST